MKCPKCDNRDLGKRNFSHPYDCSQCGGIWVRKEDMPRMDAAVFDDFGDVESGDDDRDARTGVCPEGHGIMIRARVEDEVPFYLERCSACGGIWFDRGEWQRIAGNRFLESLPDFWSHSWQRRQRQEKSRRQYLETNEEVLGSELFASLLPLAGKLRQHPEKGRALALLQQEINHREPAE